MTSSWRCVFQKVKTAALNLTMANKNDDTIHEDSTEERLVQYSKVSRLTPNVREAGISFPCY
jgi:hypothetical protein